MIGAEIWASTGGVDHHGVAHEEVVELTVGAPGWPGALADRSAEVTDLGHEGPAPVVHVATDDGGLTVGAALLQEFVERLEVERGAVGEVAHVHAEHRHDDAVHVEFGDEGAAVRAITAQVGEVDDLTAQEWKSSDDRGAPTPWFRVSVVGACGELRCERLDAVEVEGVVVTDEPLLRQPLVRCPGHGMAPTTGGVGGLEVRRSHALGDGFSNRGSTLGSPVLLNEEDVGAERHAAAHGVEGATPAIDASVQVGAGDGEGAGHVPHARGGDE